MTAYYNEIDPFAAAWLRNLIKAGAIAPGDVDERDIRDIAPDDLRGYTQCHFFAGIGVWSYALRLAGWADDRPVWTGSCPCQPFSAAGARGGVFDERHLWPHWHHLIRECRPASVFGEQVASKDGLGWLDLVSADLEGEGYAVGASDLCAAGVGAPHIRQRLWFHARDEGVADAEGRGRSGYALRQSAVGSARRIAGDSESGGLAYADDEGLEGWREPGRGRADQRAAGQDGVAGGVADTYAGQQGVVGRSGGTLRQGTSGDAWLGFGRGGEAARPRPTDGFWRDADWLYCRDGKWRPVEPGTSPLADRPAARVGRLRGYGNAIVPQVAATFIEAVMDLQP
jgi:DNA (cytosine-5)-methyltransferase 1